MHKKKTGSTKGFTLVEVLIVIAIIGILSALAIGGYTEYRKAALLNFSADSFISQIKEIKENTIYGDFGGERFAQIQEAVISDQEIAPADDQGLAKCMGFYFETFENFVRPVFFSQEFVGKQKWEGEEFVYEGCKDFNILDPDSFIETRPFEMDRSVAITKVIREGTEMTLQDFVVRFIPPEGTVEYSFSGNFQRIDSTEATIIFVLKYGQDSEDKYIKTIEMNLFTGQAKIVPNEE